MKKINLKKNYERDVSLIFEGLWGQTLFSHIQERLGVVPPHEVFVILFVNHENLQIWESETALGWYQDRLLEKNIKNPDFMQNIIAEYQQLLESIKKYWENGATGNKNDLSQFLKLTSEAFALFSIWYYSLVDDRTPEKISKILIELRNKDEFFANNDVFIKSCAEKLGISKDLVNLIFPEEFPNFPDASILEERKQGVVSINGLQHFVMPLEKFAKENEEYFFEGLLEDVNDVNQLTGQVAFQGKVEGKVKIVKNKRQVEEVKEGDIMVSPMTTPDFMPAMKKAAAFVTDEGGMLCHAAIVAREMKKPCIIGTKIATKVLKDGDMVEVDAEKGIVKILEKNDKL